MRRLEFNGSWYGDNTPAGDTVYLVRDSHIIKNGARLLLPDVDDNVLQLVAKRYGQQILIAGQSHQGKGNYLYKDGKWQIVSNSFGTFACAFSDKFLYLVVGPNQYQVYDLETGQTSPVIGRAIGVNGIRYIDFSQSIDGIVTGDSTYGPKPYNLSQWNKCGDVVIGQGYNGGAIAIYKDVRYVVEPGDCKFIHFKKNDTQLCFSILKELENKIVFYWMDISELIGFPVDKVEDKGPATIPDRIPNPKSPDIPAPPLPKVPKEEKKPEPQKEPIMVDIALSVPSFLNWRYGGGQGFEYGRKVQGGDETCHLVKNSDNTYSVKSPNGATWLSIQPDGSFEERDATQEPGSWEKFTLEGSILVEFPKQGITRPAARLLIP